MYNIGDDLSGLFECTRIVSENTRRQFEKKKERLHRIGRQFKVFKCVQYD